MENVMDRPDEPNPIPPPQSSESVTPEQKLAAREAKSIDELLGIIASPESRSAARAGFTLAKLLATRGELPSALSHYQGIWETNDPSTSPQAALVLVALAATSGNYRLASEALKSVQDSPDTSIAAKAQEVRSQLEASIRSLT